jgi:hypothetical protein
VAEDARQRDWFHKLGNILDKLPKRLQPRVKAALHEVMYAETASRHASGARFATEYGPSTEGGRRPWRRTPTCCSRSSTSPPSVEAPTRHRTSIESPFATVRLRERVTKGAGSRTKGLLMAYKLLDMAQERVASHRRCASPAARPRRRRLRGRRPQEGKASKPRTKAA